jgi:hypothetical protein
MLKQKHNNKETQNNKIRYQKHKKAPFKADEKVDVHLE